MEQINEYHRDIYSGMVANELGKQGYFGEDYRLYGFLVWIEGKKKLIFAENELRCAQMYLGYLQKGYPVTSYSSYGERIYGEQEAPIIKKTIKNKLSTKLDNLPEITWSISQQDLLALKNYAEGQMLKDGNKTLSGFAWLDDMDTVKCYCNLFLPATIQRWFQLLEEKRPVSVILMNSFYVSETPVAERREYFQKELLELFNDNYWKSTGKL